MISLAVALAVHATCTDPRVEALPEASRSAACVLVTSPPRAESASPVAPLEAIYARPEFSQARQGSGAALSWWLARAQAWLASFFETTSAQTYSNVTRVVVLVAAFALVIGLAVRWARRRARPAPGTRRSREERAVTLDDPAIHFTRASSLLEHDARGALREGLLSLLSHLERRRLARPDRTKTNRELAHELPSRGAPPAVTEQVVSLLRDYDAAFYSLAPVTPESARRFLEGVSRVQTL
ncbi:MAG: DUF4129 domain-containing protein [Archangium sp.]|nr:DUF4129 domain-containing protein [Archangium sp.]